ncbi:ribosomal protein S18-alanine N-acetyltransferase [Lacisediminimonas profundi]|uniref:ribosomal protein S18-alanine N-acetyltransferase n=1 Tax=Lacisediminimonas profundi TaxID=2603856 RepID=UPI001F4F63C4|nr:ribosomal protein S18-alanine N-acetyltransferase [Lacisediminimonas profundi]
MSSILSGRGDSLRDLQMLRMTPTDLQEVLDIEYAAYPFPWSHGNFLDSIKSGYETWVLRAPAPARQLLGYFMLMHMVDESHLLNITVHPGHQGRGLGRVMLDHAVALARTAGMKSMLLEVRPSNTRALEIYLRYGFSRVGVRRNYYPAPDKRREDAIVMRLPL